MSWFKGVTTYQKFLLAAFLLVWVLLAIQPGDRKTWLIENLLAVLYKLFSQKHSQLEHRWALMGWRVV